MPGLVRDREIGDTRMRHVCNGEREKTDMQTIGHFIGGEARQGQGSERLKVFNPATGQQSGDLAVATPDEIEATIAAAQAALRRELLDRLAAHASPLPEWRSMIDDLADLSTVEVEQDGRRALLRTALGASIDPICRALGIALPPVFQELPPTGELIHTP